MQPLQAVVLYNTASPHWEEARVRVLPYLDHFGVPCRFVDNPREPLPAGLEGCPLVILAHPGLAPALGAGDLARLRGALAGGMGLVSFDPRLSEQLLNGNLSETSPEPVDHLQITQAAHFISQRHSGGQGYDLPRPIELPVVPGEPLLAGGSRALLAVSTLERGRAITWASTEWIDPSVLGPLSGLDDLLWRGIAWAARKPFCIRGLPPLVTMRVDDVAGRGGLWAQSPLYWVEEANRAGFKPWLGLFLYNLAPPAVTQLRGLLQAGGATAFPHAFGRPPRDAKTEGFFYFEDALPLRAGSYDEFIYFDHHHEAPWPDAEAARGLAAVDRWYAAHAPLPKSKVALAHWYEMGANTLPHVADRWGADLLGKIMDADLPLASGTPWLKAGPFRRDTEGEAFPFTPGSSGKRPVYYADFVQAGGRRFFNSITEIRDDAGYEWAPDNDVAATVARAGRQLRRAFDSMALASLFTHETDFIYKIRPDAWAEIMRGVAREIAPYRPVQVTLDDGMRVLRATKTSSLQAAFDEARGEVVLTFSGSAEVRTGALLFATEDADGDAEGEWVDVPAFEGTQEVRVRP